MSSSEPKRPREDDVLEDANSKRRKTSGDDENASSYTSEDEDSSSCMSEDERGIEGEHLLLASRTGDVAMVRELLTERNVSLDVRNKYGGTPLHIASVFGHVDVVIELLDAGAAIEESDKNGETSLHAASSHGELEVVKLLHGRGANINATDNDGLTPLHYAADSDKVEVLKFLVEVGADMNARDGSTVLHHACVYHGPQVVTFLLNSDNVHARDSDGLKPLHHSIITHNWTVSTNTLQTLQALVSFGATWDTKCDEIVASGNACQEAPALRICVLQWTKDYKAGRPLTNIPIEVVQRGASDTQAYIDELRKSNTTTFRRRICVVGPSCWGKTSLIMSITTGESSLDHPDDRTIGIDIFKIEFTQGSDHYTITIWDYAGQEAYQPAHAVFFSERTVYVVCYDLHSGSLAKTQSDFRADDDADYENRMDEFVSQKTLRWIRLVFARQPDAEFVLIGTKADVIHHNASRIAEVRGDLLTRLQAYAADYEREVAREIAVVRDRLSESASTESKLSHLHKLQQYASNMAPHHWLTMSCREKQRVLNARNDLQQLIVKTKDKSFEMPEAYTKLLDSILEKRNAMAHERSRLRVHNAFASYDDLKTHLKKEIPDLTNCREILRTLHDLGDVLWYENFDTKCFKNTVIIDPLLLIDFIRQIFDHNYNGETMPHTTLVSRPFWVDVTTDDSLVLSLKQVLQHFHLVYPSWRDMEWNSDLMVPVYWRTNVHSFRQVVDLPLELKKGEACRRVRWEYHFSSELPDAVYDHFVVATYSSLEIRVVGPYGILCEQDDVNPFACRVVIRRSGRTTVMCIEALAADQAEWDQFENFVEVMEAILYEFPGLLVTRNAVNSEDIGCRLEKVLADAMKRRRSVGWLPPDLTWCRSILAFQL